MQFFNTAQVKLLNACYPPASALLAAGPDYSPNSHELSRLTYYASNHPGKLTKLGSEVEKKLKGECRKVKTGNMRSRASLLISLAILRSLATECRRDIALLSPYLLASVEYTLQSAASDLEVVARVASVFTAWTTYTNGHLIGADSSVTNDYLSILRQFALLSSSKLRDQETENRTRLIGLAALTGALSSEALYNDPSQFRAQVSIILKPILTILFQAEMSILAEQCTLVKDTPTSPYLDEFRTRPALERRAASIHVHIDGDKGPSAKDVSDASLRALFLLLSHANGAQLGHIMQSLFDTLDEFSLWTHIQHCCWLAQVITEWAQYQYRYVVPTWLVEHLMLHQDSPSSTPMQAALIAMATAVFSSSTSLINLSSSDVLSNLTNFLLRRVAISPTDSTSDAIVDCIASLGCHVYYSDQIQDLVGELIGRLIMIEVQGVLNRDNPGSPTSRFIAIRYLLLSLTNLIRVANSGEQNVLNDSSEPTVGEGHASLFTTEPVKKDRAGDDRISRRTKVPVDIWHDTLSLLCHPDPVVRRQCSTALVYYIAHEMPKFGETNDLEDAKRFRGLASHSFRHAVSGAFPNANDPASKFLNAVHAFLFVLATSPTFDRETTPDAKHSEEDVPSLKNGNPQPYAPRTSKDTLFIQLLDRSPSRLTASPAASEEDYSNILQILVAIQRHLPIRGLLCGLPMILALDNTLNSSIDCLNNVKLNARWISLKLVVANCWKNISQVWKVPHLTVLAHDAISRLERSQPSSLSEQNATDIGVNADEALSYLSSSRELQEVLDLDQEYLRRRLTMPWSPLLAFRDINGSPAYDATSRGDGVSPLLKISPALMHIENISLHSLARSTRGLGVTDLREALEGRNSMSNPALARPPSISTLDHTSSFAADASLRLTQTRSRSRAKKRPPPTGAGEVRDMLSKLGINKHNSNLLKASFSGIQKSD